MIDPSNLVVGDTVIIWITGMVGEFEARVQEVHGAPGTCIPPHELRCHHKGPWLKVTKTPSGTPWPNNLLLKGDDFIAQYLTGASACLGSGRPSTSNRCPWCGRLVASVASTGGCFSWHTRSGDPIDGSMTDCEQRLGAHSLEEAGELASAMDGQERCTRGAVTITAPAGCVLTVRIEPSRPETAAAGFPFSVCIGARKVEDGK